MSESISPEEIAAVFALHAAGKDWIRTSDRVGLSPQVCWQIWNAPRWPKLVTRIEADGTATLVRCA